MSNERKLLRELFEMRKPNTRRPLINDYPLGVTVAEMRAWLDAHPDCKEIAILTTPSSCLPITQVHFSNYAILLCPAGVNIQKSG